MSALTERGVTLHTGRAALDQIVGKGGLDPSDAEALRSFGIDLDHARHRRRARFGRGALDRSPPRRPWHRSSEAETQSGHIPFMPRTKKALERSLTQARNLGDQQVGVEHILLGLLDPNGNTAIEVLRYLGADPAAVRASVLHHLGEGA